MLAAIGGLMVPSFAMPQSFHLVMKLSPLHWCLEAYYGLFLEGRKATRYFNEYLTFAGNNRYFSSRSVCRVKD